MLAGAEIESYVAQQSAVRTSSASTSAATQAPASLHGPQPTLKVRHIFRGTAHGKDDSDPELGHHKNAADRWQLRAGDGKVARLFTPHDFFEFASTQMRQL